MNTGQIQVRITLTERLYEFLQGRAARLGLPVTQLIRHMIVKEAEREEIPVFPASKLIEQRYNEVQGNVGGFTQVRSVKKYLDSL